MKFPSIRDLAFELRHVNAQVTPPDDMCDVRLQVWDDGTWFVRTGLSDYDTDHRGHWGASCAPGRGKRFDSMSLARELLSQVRDSYAQQEDTDRWDAARRA